MRKRFNGKQIIALALAVTMVVSEVGVVQATSATEQAVEVTSEEVSEQSQAPEITSEEVTEQSQALDITSEEVKEQESTTEVPASATPVTSLTVPGKVTNLRFDDEIVNGIMDNTYLSWNAIQEADGYQIKVVDANGVEYASGTTMNSETNASELSYASTGNVYYYLSNTIDSYNFRAYELKDGQYVLKQDDKGNYYYVKKGEEYKVSIRAYNNGYVDVTNTDGTTTEEYKIVYGEWSDAVSYKIPVTSAVEKITDVKVVEETDGYSYLSFKLGRNERYQVEIKDAQGREYYENWLGSEWDGTKYVDTLIYCYGYGSKFDLDETSRGYVYEYKDGSETPTKLLVTDADGNTSTVTAFQPGQTYTLRVRGAVEGADGKDVYSEWSDAVTYTCTDDVAPEQPGQLKYNEKNPYNVTWNSAKNADGYEVELKDAAGNWYNTYSREYNETNQRYEYVLKNIEVSYNSLYMLYQYAYTLTEDVTKAPVATKDAEGNSIRPGVEGQTYTVRVRAYNTKKDGERQYSEWSTALTFTVPKEEPEAPKTDSAPTKVENVTVREDGYVQWDAEQNASDSTYTTYYDVEIKDAAGREYYRSYSYDATKNAYVYQYVSGSYTSAWADGYNTYTMVDGNPSAVINPADGYAIRSFEEPGETYKVRVRAYRQMNTDVNADGKIDANDIAYGEWSNEVSETVPSDSYGVNAVPAKVTGVWIETEPEDDSRLDGPIMHWNSIENVSRYEFEIKDSKGNLYTSYPSMINGEYMTLYPSVGGGDTYPAEYLDDWYYHSYVMTPGSAITTVKNADGTSAETFEVGETYTIRVRAVNRYKEYDAATKTYKTVVEHTGEWSDAVTYVYGANASAVTGLSYVKADEDYYYFTYNADVVNSTMYYQVATDADFDSASVVKNWTAISNDNDGNDYKLRISKTATYLDPSTTYYVRVVNSIYGNPRYDMEVSDYNAILATAATTTFTTEAEEVETPKNITGLRVYRESDYEYVLRFNAVLEENDYYEIQIASSATAANWKTIDYDSDEDGIYIYSDDLLEGTTYIRAIAYINQKDEKTGKVEKVYGTPSNVISITRDVPSDVTTPIGTLKYVEETESSYGFTYSGNLRDDENVEIWYSDSKNFDTNGKSDTTYYQIDSNDKKKFYIYKSDLKPGKTYYVKVRTYNGEANSSISRYSAYSGVVKITTSVPKVYVSASAVTKNSIKIAMSSLYDTDWVTGYEIQKKSVKNKKTTWTTLSKSSASVYTDKKLKADTTYTYRIRPYYFDDETGKIANGSWVYYEAMTGFGGNMKLTAKAASKTSIKLSWNKITGAKGYEIYRAVTSSNTTQYSGGYEGYYDWYNNSYTKYKLVATVSAKKKTYTDKKLTSGMSYTYVVKAYKTVNGKKVYIEDSVYATLDFVLQKVNTVQKSNGKVTVTWNPVYTAKGYQIEKYDAKTGEWNTYKTIKKAKTSSYTFPATSDENGVKYRIRAYNGKKYTDYIDVDVYPVLAAPTNVKAKVSGQTVKISWKAVKGADYYRVFRTSSAWSSYDKDLKEYYYNGATEVGRYVADSTTVSGYRYRDLEEMNVTSVVDQEITYSYNGIDGQTLVAGPDTGVKYYYYVIAYKNNSQHEYVYDNDEAYYEGAYYSSGCSKAASATIKETKPAKTSISKATSKSKSVTLTFKASKNADGYEIVRSTKKKSGYKVIGTVNDPTKLTYKDKYNKKTNKLKKGKSYYYKVRAFKYNDDGSKVYSSYSSPKKVKVK